MTQDDESQLCLQGLIMQRHTNKDLPLKKHSGELALFATSTLYSKLDALVWNTWRILNIQVFSRLKLELRHPWRMINILFRMA